ncbi:MAG: c-type cytochrome [Deltaproteobacteria bacterium]|nr:c-type cytochrome [Deltaproteobacteria bacterium]
MKKKNSFMPLVFLFIIMTISYPGAGALAEDSLAPRINPGRLRSIRLIKNPLPLDEQSVAAGKEIYFGKGICFSCHGDTGKGNGPSGAGLDPRPRDFTSIAWQKVRTDAEIYTVINEGTQFGMMAYGNSLTEEERWDLVNYIRTLGVAEDFPPRVNPGRLPEVKLMKNPVRPDSKSVALGKEIYFGKGICVSCHGESGKGDGQSGASFNPGPRDFTNTTWQNLRTDGEIFVAINEGTQLGMMAFGDNLTEQEVWSLVNYLREIGKGK